MATKTFSPMQEIYGTLTRYIEDEIVMSNNFFAQFSNLYEKIQKDVRHKDSTHTYSLNKNVTLDQFKLLVTEARNYNEYQAMEIINHPVTNRFGFMTEQEFNEYREAQEETIHRYAEYEQAIALIESVINKF